MSALNSSSVQALMGTLQEFFASRSVEAYLVGGAVRDTLLGRATQDIDVAVTAKAHSVGRELAASIGARFVLLDEARDIVRVVITEGGSFVDISPLPTGILDNLGQRDFTLDAMAVPLADASAEDLWEHVIDPYGGLIDLRDGTIRAVTHSIFEADPIRLMRALRLAVQLHFRIEEGTVQRIRLDAHLIDRVAPERIRDELLKLLAEPGVKSTLYALDDLGILCQIIPELSQAKAVTQPTEHYWDVFDHLLETAGQVEKVVQEHPNADGFVVELMPRFEFIGEHFATEVSDGHTRLTLLKLAGLLHDIAKPTTKTVDDSGRIRFLGHDAQGAEMSREILRRLRFSRRAVELVQLMVKNHLRPGQMARRGELPTNRAIYRYCRDVGGAAIDTLYLNMADHLAARGPSLHRDGWSEYCRVTQHVLWECLQNKTKGPHPKLISGHDIMRTFSLASGPKVGTLLDLVREAHATGKITTREEALKLANTMLEMGDNGA